MGTQTVKAIADAIGKLLGLLDPALADKRRIKKAFDWAEKYIFTAEKISALLTLNDAVNKTKLSSNEKRRLKALQKKLRHYRKWFFDYS